MKFEQFLSRSYLFAVSHAFEVIWKRLNGKLKTVGLNVNEAFILLAIFFEQNGEVNPSMLADTLNVSRGTISQSLSHLESKGLLRRELKAQDKRQLIVQLTPAGAKLTKTLIGLIEEIEDQAEEHFKEAKAAGALGAMLSLKTRS